MIEVAVSVLLIASVIFLVYELRKFRLLHSKKYELPTEKIWEKFVGIRPEEMTDSDLTSKFQHLEKKMDDLHEDFRKQRKLTKKLIEELGK
ncbi:MAG: hypothetical protein JSV63_03395 [Candidatus Aenigmatarchaeota archaeon]|nr:MAG: hypothetical protein JSV63_03395 [Candidatus Aenigmarchaeota archaeon]